MIDSDFIGALSCPYCRSDLEVSNAQPRPQGEIRHGIVRCSCYEYPIVDGILVLRQLSGASDTYDRAVELLRTGDVDGARSHLEAVASMVPRPITDRGTGPVERLRTMAAGWSRSARRSLARERPDDSADRHTAPLRLALDATRPRAYATYLYQRYANPSFVASVPMMALLETVERARSGRSTATVLDLACGIGHSTAMMATLFPTMEFVAADPDFINLQLLQRHFVDRATCVCLDAELPLPFADDQFDAVFCLDAFHYIRAKWALTRELDRVVDERGMWIFPHLHNAAVQNISPGIPLRPEEWSRMLDFAGGGVLQDESQVLDDFMVRHVLDLTDPPTPPALARAPNLAMYGTRRTDLARRFDIGRRLVDNTRIERLGVNPIYAITVERSVVKLRVAWPDQQLERECADIVPYLPDEIELDRGMLDRIRSGAVTHDDEQVLERLVTSFVLVPVAAGYHDIAGSLAALSHPRSEAD